jgi:hypothetical protein
MKSKKPLKLPKETTDNEIQLEAGLKLEINSSQSDEQQDEFKQDDGVHRNPKEIKLILSNN